MNKFDNFLALEASAGSGKTFALSVRFVALILRGESLNNILALTFTNKAAKQMKERIVELFVNLDVKKNDKYIYEAELNELCKSLNINDFNEIFALQKKYLKPFLEHELKIGTFDSFFIKILRSFAPNVGLSPDFELCNDSDNSKYFVDFLNEENLRRLILYLKTSSASFNSFFEQLKIYFKSGAKEIKTPNTHHNYDIFDALNKLKSIVFTSEIKALNSVYLKKSLEQNYDNFSIFDATFLDESKKYVQNALSVDEFKKAFENLKFQLLCFARNMFYKKIDFINQISNIFLKSLKKLNIKENTLSFSDVAFMVYEILQNENLKDLLNFRLNMQIDHILIDEFQDTNIVQFNILKPIAEEILSGIGVKDRQKTLFYVGDKKQSIYRFRGGNSETFDAFAKLGDIKTKFLDTNYRSAKNIVEFVNQCFEPLYKNYGVHFEKALVNSKNEGCVKFISTDKTNSFENCLKTINGLVKNNEKLENICVLVRKNQTANDLEKYLEQNNIKATANSSNDTLLIDEISVKTLIEYAKWCIFGDDAYYEFVRFKIGDVRRVGFKDFKDYSLKKDDEKNEENDKENGKKTIEIYLNLDENAGIIYLKLLKYLGIKTNQNILKYIAWASKQESFLDTLFNPCDLKFSNDKKDLGVCIMTVHSSKGLEFKNVIVLDEKSTPKNEQFFIDYSFETNEFLGVFSDKIFNFLKENDKYFNEIYQNYIFRNSLNELNVAYVAATRARNNLIFIYLDEKSSYQMLNLQDYENLGEFEKNEEKIIKKEIKSKKIYLENVPKQKTNKSSFAISDAIKIGNCLHYYMEFWDFNGFSDELFLIMKNEFRFYNENIFEKVKKMIMKVMENTEFLRLLDGAKIFKEYEFVLDDGNVGRIDLLIIKNNEIWIVDYKSGNEDKLHKKQLDFYKNAVEKYLLNTYNTNKIKQCILHVRVDKCYFKTLN